MILNIVRVRREVMESLGVMNLEGFGIGLDHLALGVAGALLIYAQDVLKGKAR